MKRGDRKPLNPQRGRYFMRNFFFNLVLRSIDAVLSAGCALLSSSKPPSEVRRVLIANSAHLGDIVMSTAVLPVLKASFPNARIGMLVGSWAGPIVQGHELLDWVHQVDHWRQNRAELPLKTKIGRWWQSRRQAIREIRDVDYDIAIDLYFYFPNSIALFWQAQIPYRVGYSSGGLGPLLTRALDMDMKLNRSFIVDLHLELVRQIACNGTLRNDLAFPSIPRSKVDVKAIVGSTNYVVLHIGTGDERRDWPESSWITLAQQLRSKGQLLVLTGSGSREREKIKRFRDAIPEALDLCDRLKWKEFIEVIACAKLLISGNTVAPHIAYAVHTPVIVVNHGINNLHLWHKPSQHTVILMNPVECAPCYRNTGCFSMACLRELSPALVLAEVMRIIS